MDLLARARRHRGALRAGPGNQVVGAPTSATGRRRPAKPIVTASLIQTGDLASGEIDRAVAETAREGKPLYAIDEEQWAEIDADMVVMQELCDVCAVSADEVEGPCARGHWTSACSTSRRRRSASRTRSASSARGWQPHPPLRSWRRGCRTASTGWPRRSRPSRRRRASSSRSGSSRRTPQGIGPDMVAAARGTDVAGMSGEPSHRMRWQDVAALEPDVVVLPRAGSISTALSRRSSRSTSRLIFWDAGPPGEPRLRRRRERAVLAAEPSRRRRRRAPRVPAAPERVPGSGRSLEPHPL